MKQRTMLQRTAPLLPASKPVYAGGSMAKISGSAAPQNTTPAPIPVHSEMPNHCIMVNLGLALGPPNLTFPRGVTITTIQNMTMARHTRLENQPSPHIALFITRL